MEFPPSAGGAPAFDPGSLPAPVHEAIAGLDRPANAFLYDPAVAQRQAAALRRALPSWVDVLYAVKANSFGPVVDALATVVDGFEVASGAEAAQVMVAASRAGRPPHAVASGPGKSRALLHSLLDAGVDVVNVESRLELERTAAIGRERGSPVPVALRVNPARVEVSGALAMGGRSTPFGIPEEEVPAVLARAVADAGVDVVGFHVHAVCGNVDALAHAAYVRWCLEWSEKAAADAGVDLRLVDAGGGLGVAFGGGPSFDLDLFGDAVSRLRAPDGCRLAVEPGRWLAADCGWYVTEVVDVKHARGTWYAVVRGGINHFMLPASWELVHRFAVLPVESWGDGPYRPGVQGEPITVVGELCTPEDVLARDVRVGAVRAGDVLVFPQAGSYGWEFALQEFLQHPRAPRICIGSSSSRHLRTA